MDILSGTVTTAGTREIAQRLAEFVKRAEGGEVIDIVDQRGPGLPASRLSRGRTA